MEAMETGGILSIQLEDHEDEILIVFKDNGWGLSEEEAEAVFDPTRRVSSPYRTRSKNLSMCKVILEKYHGKIHVESSVGLGSRFEMRLPRLS